MSVAEHQRSSTAVAAAAAEATAVVCVLPSIAMAAVSKNPRILQDLAAFNLHGDEDIVLAAVLKDASVFQHAACQLRSSRDFFLRLIKQCPPSARAIELASEQLRGDEIVMLKVACVGEAFAPPTASHTSEFRRARADVRRPRCPVRPRYQKLEH